MAEAIFKEIIVQFLKLVKKKKIHRFRNLSESKAI